MPLVWLGLSVELTLLPERIDRSTGDSWNNGDELSESVELRFSETISGGGLKCSRRLSRDVGE